MLTIALFWFILALLLALIEIEIEGKNGWAEKLPTWYRTSGISKLYGIITGSRPLTGYHLFMNILIIMMFHSCFFNGAEWSAKAELVLLSRYLVFAVFWDFLWFILNPHYGIKNFKKNKIWWHSKIHWIRGLFPADYLVGLSVSLVLSIIATGITRDAGVLKNHLVFFGLFFVFALLIICNVAPVYMWWHKWMRRKDDRDKAGIFHAD